MPKQNGNPKILAAGAAVQLLTGIPAAWGVFQKPVGAEYGLSSQQCSLIFFSLDRRIHLEPSVIFDIIPGKHQIMRRRFTGDIQSFRLGAAHQLHRFSSGNVTDCGALTSYALSPCSAKLDCCPAEAVSIHSLSFLSDRIHLRSEPR